MGAPWTPGPWRVPLRRGAVVADHPVPGINGSDDVSYYGGHLIAESIAPHNRDLIAAAPDLAEACRMLVESYDADMGTYALGKLYEARQAARAALSKARGETE